MDNVGVYPLAGLHEPVNCLTHFLAAPVFAVLGYYLVRRGRGDWGRTVSLVVMTLSTVFLLSMSAAYHALEPGPRRQMMRQFDMAAVYTLIAGTATPLHAILFKGFNRWAPLFVVWSAAAIGIGSRILFPEKVPSAAVTPVFLVLGWGGLISCVLLWKRYGFAFVKPLLLGGIAYTLGAIMLDLNWPVLIRTAVGAHELWHLAVLVGLGYHWRFVFQFADGLPEAVPG
jgi:channel protein (hemolysin III family)